MEINVRLDKFLWAVRLFKTRSQASEACRLSRVMSNELTLKPSFKVNEGLEFSVKKDQFVNQYRIKAILDKRVSAKLVELYLEDLTPLEEYERRKYIRQRSFEKRERGIGRPTKKDRREIEFLKKFEK